MLLAVYPGQPTTVADNADFATVEGRNNKFGKQMNQNIRWGVGAKILSL